ncbi:MAG: general secretion pathway protein GspB, partial [Burkholderiales bacterium]|nr:general secretion pathway protein GspB [Burkholderiales bacterium]
PARVESPRPALRIPPPSSPPASLPSTPPVQPPAPLAPAAAPRPWSQLTPAQQRAWPPLALGGVIWSANAASRVLIVNGQVAREGDIVAPGVVLERIGPRSAVLRRQGERVEMPF